MKMKFGTNDYVSDGNPQPTFGNSQFTGAFSPYGWNITFRHSADNFFNVMLFLTKATEGISEPILMSTIS